MIRVAKMAQRKAHKCIKAEVSGRWHATVTFPGSSSFKVGVRASMRLRYLEIATELLKTLCQVIRAGPAAASDFAGGGPPCRHGKTPWCRGWEQMGLQQLRPADAHQLPACQCSYLCPIAARLTKCNIVVFTCMSLHLICMSSHLIVPRSEVIVMLTKWPRGYH